ncbi:hypothetical protein SDC9_109213 [bioreactor metagenome]|uniref:Uncharacterized protein n=1 Tax=bioreactor metagenome TaxID=1076179 RepID=A0A645BAC3_9ZZZZ
MGVAVGKGREQQAIGTIELFEGSITIGKRTVLPDIRDGGPLKGQSPVSDHVLLVILCQDGCMAEYHGFGFIVHCFFQSTNCCFLTSTKPLSLILSSGETGRLSTAKFMISSLA